MKIKEGAFSLAYLKSSLTLAAPTPTYLLTKSDPLIEKKEILDSLAHALAKRVLPVPGGPVIKAPLGILAPRIV
jgi:hypothetical protein